VLLQTLQGSGRYDNLVGLQTLWGGVSCRLTHSVALSLKIVQSSINIIPNKQSSQYDYYVTTKRDKFVRFIFGIKLLIDVTYVQLKINIVFNTFILDLYDWKKDRLTHAKIIRYRK
jgi:hypothetical protein